MLTYAYYGFHHVPNWKWFVPAKGQADYTLWSVWGGKGSLQVGERKYELQKGDVFLLDYSQPVCGMEDDNDCLEVRFLDFGVDATKFLEGQPVHRRFERTSFLMELMKRVALAQSEGNAQALLSWAEAVVCEYCGQAKTAPCSFYTEKIDALCAQFELHPEAHYDVGEMAQSFGLTIDHFIRVFAKEKGITPYAYLSKVRVDSAKTLLLNSSLSVSQIATLVGFSDLYNFSRFFKNATGSSPLQYKRTRGIDNGLIM